MAGIDLSNVYVEVRRKDNQPLSRKDCDTVVESSGLRGRWRLLSQGKCLRSPDKGFADWDKASALKDKMQAALGDDAFTVRAFAYMGLF